MLPVVAIVGQPNVGKSTLFNVLTQSRSALVVDLPGTTRDRQYGEGKVGSQPYILIDTGGLDTDDQIDKQSWEAIKQANTILFVVDAKVGITHADLALVKKLHKIKKPVHLVLNKTDGMDLATTKSEFYSLGLGEPIAISAGQKRGILQLTEAFLADFAAQAAASVSEEEDQEGEALLSSEEAGIKIAFIGQPNVGKSTLVNRMLGEERVIVSDVAGTTRDSIYIPFTREGQEYTLIDTAGVRRKGKIKETVEKFSVIKSLQAIEAANVVIFVIDAYKGVTDQDLSLLSFVVDAGRALIIAINKWDSLDANGKDQLNRTLKYKLQFVDFAIITQISALHGSGVGNLWPAIKQAYRAAMKKLPTPIITKLLEEFTATHQLPLVNGRRIKLRYAHSGGHNPPRIIIHGNQATKVPATYVRYLQKSFSERLKLQGTPLVLEFITGENPYAGKRNTLTPRQMQKRQRLQRHAKKAKKSKQKDRRK